MTDDAWADLDRELDRWRSAGRRATLWLRDDDAVQLTQALDRLLDLADRAAVPLALAVVPAGATPALARRLAGLRAVSVLQHGYAHANHAGPGAKKSEYAEGRPLEAMTGELVRGRTTISRLFGDAATPVLAPPWNRIAPGLVGHLRACGLAGLSRFTPRRRPFAAAGVVEANAHVDLIEWRAGRTGKPAALIAAEAAAHLRARREGAVDAEEPTGLLAHHLAMDETAWAALAGLLDRFGRDARAAWLDAPTVFQNSATGSEA